MAKPSYPCAESTFVETLEPRIAPTVFLVANTDDFTASDGPSYVGTLRWAIAQSEANGPAKDTIVFDPGVFVEGKTIALTKGQIVITGNLEIKGLGPDRVTIDAGGNSRHFVIDDGLATVNTVSISGLTLTGGTSAALQSGGSIFTRENLSLDHVVLSGNATGFYGGAVASESAASLTIRNSVIVNNYSPYRGGGVSFYSEKATVSVSNSLFSGNVSGIQGGGLDVRASGSSSPMHLSIVNTAFVDNSAAVAGGGLGLSATGDTFTVSLKNVVASDNSASRGGGIHVWDSGFGGEFKFAASKLLLSNNVASDTGGGMFIISLGSNDSFTLQGASILGNTAAKGAGGIGMDSTGESSLKVIGSQFAGNATDKGSGGGLWATGSGILEVKASKFEGNQAESGGAIALSKFATATISGARLVGNSASYLGGGLSLADSSSALLLKTQILGNEADSGGGIGMMDASTLTAAGLRIAGNVAGAGAGVLAVGTGSLEITQSVIEANHAGLFGGGVFVSLTGPSSDLTLISTKLTGNLAEGSGGGVFAKIDAGSFASVGNTFKHNVSGGEGGALHLRGAVDGIITKTAIHDNLASGKGGGIYSLISPGGSLQIIGGSIRANSAQGAGGGLFDDGSLALVAIKGTAIGGNFSHHAGSLATANTNVPGFIPPPTKGTSGTFLVTSDADSGPGTLRQAIDNANAAGKGSIGFDVSMAGKTITLATDLPTITSNVKINGLGVDQVAVSGAGSFRPFAFDAGAANTKSSLSGIAIVDAKSATDGGAIVNAETLSLTKVVISSAATSGLGGALAAGPDARTTITGVHVTFNAATSAGAGVHSTGQALTITNSLIAGNATTGGVGGGVSSLLSGGASLKISGTIFAENKAVLGDGGAISLELTNAKNTANISSTIVIGNDAITAGFEGGGISVQSAPSAPVALNVKSTIFTNNSAWNAGAIATLSYGGTMNLAASQFFNNSATKNGGALVLAGPQSSLVSSSLFVGNSATTGGAGVIISLGASLTINKTDFVGNSATSLGGALQLQSLGSSAISGSRFAGNTSDGYGGAINAKAAPLTIAASALLGNSAGKSGGAISDVLGGSLQIMKSVISGNSAGEDGGGLNLTNLASVSIGGTVFAGNSAGVFGGGLAAVVSGNPLSIQGGSFVANTATIGGGASIQTGVYPASTTITGTSFLSNRSAEYGGGINLTGAGPVSISNAIIRMNLAGTATTKFDGGGIFHGVGVLSLNRGLITGNVSTSTGGGLYESAPYTVNGTKIVGNWSPSAPNIG